MRLALAPRMNLIRASVLSFVDWSTAAAAADKSRGQERQEIRHNTIRNSGCGCRTRKDGIRQFVWNLCEPPLLPLLLANPASHLTPLIESSGERSRARDPLQDRPAENHVPFPTDSCSRLVHCGHSRYIPSLLYYHPSLCSSSSAFQIELCVPHQSIVPPCVLRGAAGNEGKREGNEIPRKWDGERCWELCRTGSSQHSQHRGCWGGGALLTVPLSSECGMRNESSRLWISSEPQQDVCWGKLWNMFEHKRA